LVKDQARPDRISLCRQHPIERYVLDFYCPEAKLCVELDGDIHADRTDKDQARDEALDSQGITVMRVHSQHAWHNLDQAVEEILATCIELTGRDPFPAPD
jgi:very-short-patch-repair endonuclease